MDVINTLRKSRFRAADYYDLTATDATDALVKVLAERRKELMGVGRFRWADLKRLNKESRFAKTIAHPFLTQTFTLLLEVIDTNFLLLLFISNWHQICNKTIR